MAIYLPEKCLRLRKDCEPLAQIEADEEPRSFVCCGHISPHERTIPQDRFRLCWKNEIVDEMGDYDRRDVTDTMSVLAQALSVDANREENYE